MNKTYATDYKKYFHDKHAKTLKEQGILTPQTEASFEQLCTLYATLKKWESELVDNEKLIRPWLDLQGKFTTLARAFNCLPAKSYLDKPQAQNRVKEFDFE